MLPSRLHLVSALCGAGVATLVLFTTSAVQERGSMSQVSPGNNQEAVILPVGPVAVAGIPTPSQMMRVEEGTPFSVPPEKVFVVTGVGSNTTNTSINITVSFDAVSVWHWKVRTNDVQSTPAVPPGLVAQAGEVVSVVDDHTGRAVILGYLADV